jgi:iron complex transport system substrate-binding protein
VAEIVWRLFGKEKEGQIIFDNIVKKLQEAQQLVSKSTSTVLYGSMYQEPMVYS